MHQTDIFGSESGYFELSLNSYLDAFSMESKFQTHPGHRYEVYVNVIEVTADSAVMNSVDIEDRQCRYRNESHSSNTPLKGYTQKGRSRLPSCTSFEAEKYRYAEKIDFDTNIYERLQGGCQTPY